jgi:hypothetical protein
VEYLQNETDFIRFDFYSLYKGSVLYLVLSYVYVRQAGRHYIFQIEPATKLFLAHHHMIS